MKTSYAQFIRSTNTKSQFFKPKGPPSSGNRILIVDDQNFNIEALKIILTFICKLPDEIIDIAMSGQAAINLIKANVQQNKNRDCNYTLILCDCNMPIIDGYETTL